MGLGKWGARRPGICPGGRFTKRPYMNAAGVGDIGGVAGGECTKRPYGNAAGVGDIGALAEANARIVPTGTRPVWVTSGRWRKRMHESSLHECGRCR